MTLRGLLIAIVAILALTSGLWWSLHAKQRPEVDALWLKQPRTLAAVTLLDQNKQAFSQEQLQGNWTLLFVGYTSCPDICPTTMADLARLYPKIGLDDFQVVMLSVDPQRDEPEKLKNYVRFFNPAFKAVTGEHSQLYPFTQSLGLVYALADNPNGGEYMVDHSADIVLLNPNGELEAIFRPQGELGQLRTVPMTQLERELPLIIGHSS